MQHIPLTRGLQALVDDDEHERLSNRKWLAVPSSNGRAFYAARHEGPAKARRLVLMHRLIAGAPDGVDVDHINLDTLDNQRSNLRLATKSQNCANRRILPNNTTGYKGVCLAKATGRWYATIYWQNTQRWPGSFATAVDAAVAFDRAAVELFGPFARLNFPAADQRGARS